MWSRKELKSRAKEVLKVSYWKAFLVSLILAFIGGNLGSSSANFHVDSGDNPINLIKTTELGVETLLYILLAIFFVILGISIFLALRIFLGYPIEVGCRRYFTQAAQNNSDLNQLGYAFDGKKYWDIVKAMLWRGFLNFLWFLLLIIPGIVKFYAYRMVPYILSDNPNIGYRRALELSVKMTAGQKFQIFVLDLSFLGWYILGILLFFIGILFVLPYVNATEAELYLVLRQKALQDEICTYQELRLEPVI